MRLLCVSDIHLLGENVLLLRERLNAVPVDAVIVCGDLTTNGSEFAAGEILKNLRMIGKVFAVQGNMDTKEVAELLEKKGNLIHNKIFSFKNYNIAGFGGALEGNAGHFNFREKEIEKNLSGLLQGDCSRTLLVTHLPPFGTSLDLNASGKHTGSKALKKIIEEKQPLLHVCGHCHESLGEELFGRTISVNVGALKDGNAALLDLDGKIKIERIKIF